MSEHKDDEVLRQIRTQATTEREEHDRVKLIELRDKFAIAALTGVCVSPISDRASSEDIAETVWHIADAMMKARGL